MPAVNTYKSPAQRRGERYLLDRNLLASPKALKNIESVKRKARAIRLKEEYQQKYFTKRRSSVDSNSHLSQDLTALRGITEDRILIIEPEISESTYSIVKRTLSFCITLWLTFLAVIIFCTLVGYYIRFIYY
jgi:hypothetical protein